MADTLTRRQRQQLAEHEHAQDVETQQLMRDREYELWCWADILPPALSAYRTGPDTPPTLAMLITLP